MVGQRVVLGDALQCAFQFQLLLAAALAFVVLVEHNRAGIGARSGVNGRGGEEERLASAHSEPSGSGGSGGGIYEDRSNEGKVSF